MSQPTPEQARALREFLAIIVEVVGDAGEFGAPGGVMYAAMMDKLSLSQFEAIMGALVRTGRLTKRGERYFLAGAK